MKIIQWEEETLALAMPPLDRQHRELHEIGYDLSLLNSMDSDFFIQTFDRFIKALKVHFSSEEVLFERFRYPKAQEHKQRHKEFLDRMLRVQANPSGTTFNRLIPYVADWLRAHITGDDRVFTQYFRDNNIVLVDDYFESLEQWRVKPPQGAQVVKPKQAPVNSRIRGLEEQHHELGRVIQQIRDLHKTGVSQNRTILMMPNLLQLLQDCADYLELEEQRMAEQGYAGLGAQQEDHQRFKEKVEELFNRYKKQKQDLSNDILLFLKEWTTSHVVKLDGEYKVFLFKKRFD